MANKKINRIKVMLAEKGEPTNGSLYKLAKILPPSLNGARMRHNLV